MLSPSARYRNRKKHCIKFQPAYRRLTRICLLLTDSVCRYLRLSRRAFFRIAGHVRGLVLIIIRSASLREKPATASSFQPARLIEQTLAVMTAAGTPNDANTKETGAFSEAFKERLHEIRRIIEEDRYRKRVLLLCQQSEPRSFEEYSSR